MILIFNYLNNLTVFTGDKESMMRELQGKMSRDTSPYAMGRDIGNTDKSNANISKDKDDRKLPIKPIVKKNILDFDSDSESENDKLEDYINSSNANKNNSDVNTNVKTNSNTNNSTNNVNTNTGNAVKTLTKSNSKESLKSFDSGSSFNIIYGQQEPEGAVSFKYFFCSYL
jgi:hypothetical protein